MNGATEATLAELLAEAKAMNVNLVSLNRMINSPNSGINSASNRAAQGVNNLGNAASNAGTKLNLLAAAGNVISGTFSFFSGIISSVIGGLTETAKSLYAFSLKAAEGTARLSDFYDSFKNLPLGLGTLMGILADQTRINERLLDTYRSITSAGVSFGGSLSDVRDAATRTFLSFEELGRVSRDNSEIFATMGGNVDRGFNKFVDTQNKLITKFGSQLLGLGLTSEGAANMLAIFMNNAGNLSRAELANNDLLAQSVVNITTQMDAYSKITGKSREALEAEMKKKSFDAAWKTFTAGMSPEKAASALAAIELATAKGGEGAGDALKQMFMTGGQISTPITEAAKAFYVQTQGGAETFTQQMYDSVQNMRAGSEEQLSMQMEATRRLGQQYNEFIGPMGEMGAIRSLQGDKFVNNFNLMNTALVDGRRTQAEQQRAVAEALQKQKDQANGSAQSFAKAELNIRQFGNALNGIIGGVLAPFLELAQRFSQAFLEYLIPVATDLAKWLGDQLQAIRSAYGSGGFTAAFQQILKSLGSGVDNLIEMFKPTWEKIQPMVMTAIDDTWNFVKPYMVRAFDGLVEFLKPYLMRGFAAIMDEINGQIYKMTGGRYGDDRNRSEIRREFDFQQSIIDATNKAIRDGNASAEQLAASVVAKNKQLQLSEIEKRYIGLSDSEKEKWRMPEVRHKGTLGMTGNWWEKENATLNVQAGESVVTEDQMRQIVDTASQSGLADSINRLNSLTAELIRTTKQVAANTAANVSATKSLNDNLWAA